MKLVLFAAVSMLGLPALGHAQGVSSTDDLIRMLKPHAGGPTRGIRPVEPSAMAAPPTAVRQAAARVPMAAPAAAPVAAASAAPVAAAPAVAAAVASAPSAGVASVNMRILFENGSDRLTPDAMHALDNLGRALSSAELRDYKFRIEGHTDAVGTRESNDALSARRAAAVMDYIATHYSVERARLVAVGLGQTQPLVPTADGIAEPRNRRVQIVNLGS